MLVPCPYGVRKSTRPTNYVEGTRLFVALFVVFGGWYFVAPSQNGAVGQTVSILFTTT